MKKKETSENKIICPNCKKEIGIEVKMEAKVKPLNGPVLREWKKIEGFEYKNDRPEIVPYVELIYKHIEQYHNVRCVKTSSGQPIPGHEYICKFKDTDIDPPLDGGHGIVKENWVTKDNITSGVWYWEVELIGGM